MKIELSQSGGLAYLPGLQKPALVDVDRLGAAEQDEIKRLIDASHFFKLPRTVGIPAKGAADYQQNIMTIEDGERRHTVKILVPSDDVSLRELVQVVQRHARAARAALRGTADPSAGKSGE